MTNAQVQLAFNAPMQVGECPLWDHEAGVLYWVDIDGCAVHRLRPTDQRHNTWSMPSEPGCIALCGASRLLVALRDGLCLLDANSGSMTPLGSVAPYDTSTTRFNDGRSDAAGRLWVGSIYEPRDMPAGTLYRVEHGAIVDQRKPVTVSNGLAFSPDDRTLYHADTRAHRIMAYDFDVVTGSIREGRVLKQFSAERDANYGGRPDGAAVDVEGAYWSAMFDGGRLLRLSPEGEILREVPLPVRCPTMMAFGGPDLRTLFITSARHNRPVDELARHPHSGCLFSLDVEVPGRPEHLYRL
ncbi:MAG: Gluconolactonase [Herminiimonas sp.]|nr:Gluconolactonase [Herminiimonas sp.]MDB5853394.1 Gluconolactonase [Herminiimonas sp.]